VTPYYEDAQVTLYHGDCLELDAWLAADVLVTDPPYGINYHSGSRREKLSRSIVGDKDTAARDAALELWSPGAALVFGTWRAARPFGTRARLIWDTKGALGMGDLSIPWKPSDQEIYVLGAGFSGRRDSNVLTCAPVQSMASNGRQHPHEKPVSLLERLIDKCPPGRVADPFAGSGSTLVAARNVGRKSIGVEIEERYCEIIAKRLDQMCLDFGEGA
jgi:site-specific DNA-methyltransferase (adenine-specific)